MTETSEKKIVRLFGSIGPSYESTELGNIAYHAMVLVAAGLFAFDLLGIASPRTIADVNNFVHGAGLVVVLILLVVFKMTSRKIPPSES